MESFRDIAELACHAWLGCLSIAPRSQDSAVHTDELGRPHDSDRREPGRGQRYSTFNH